MLISFKLLSADETLFVCTVGEKLRIIVILLVFVISNDVFKVNAMMNYLSSIVLLSADARTAVYLSDLPAHLPTVIIFII